MRTYVSTLGFHETRVTRPVIKYGLNGDDTVILVRPADERGSDRADDAIGYVEDMLTEIAPDVTVVTERVDTADFTSTVLQCGDLLDGVDPGRELIVNFGGGAREVLLPLLIATVLHAPAVDRTFQYTDVQQEVREITVPDLTAQIPTSAMETFESIIDADGAVSLPDLATQSPKSKSTVSRHVEELAKASLVETQTVDNRKEIELSETGRLVAEGVR